MPTHHIRSVGGTFTGTPPFEVVRGTTFITRELSGYQRACLEDDRDPAEPLTTYTGPGAGGLLSVTGAGEEFHYVNFGTTRIALAGADQVIRGSKLTNTRTDWGTGSGGISQIDCGNANTLRATIEFNDIVNNGNTHQAAQAVAGHDYTADGNYVSGYIDSFGIWNTTLSTKTDPVNVYIRENLCDWMAYYWNASTGVVHPSDNETHNEHVQWHNGSVGEVIGNVFRVRFRTDIGDQTHRIAEHGHALNLTNAVGGVHSFKVNDNWTFGGHVPFNFGTGPVGGLTGFTELLRNKFDLTHTTEAPVFLDPLWVGAFGIGNADVNAYMGAGPDYPRVPTSPVTIRRNV